MFWSQVKKDVAGGCWTWTGKTIKGGYGDYRVSVDGQSRHVIAHRWAWTETHGEIPPGMFVLHRCDNPPCVNPAHLFLGSHRENMADMVAKGRRGDKKGAANGRCKITPGIVNEIRRRMNVEGESSASVARLVGLHPATVRKIAAGKRWAHVPVAASKASA